MTSCFSVPKNEFWQYALKLYSKHLVKETCLTLQDNYAMNVNVLLYCIWYATSARGKLDQNKFSLIHHAINQWHHQLVAPIRALRKKIKKDHEQFAELRKEILSIEIEAEQIEQWFILSAHAGTVKPYKTVRLKIEDCVFNFYQYLQFLNIKLDKTIYDCLNRLLSEIFQKNVSANKFEQMVLPALEN